MRRRRFQSIATTSPKSKIRINFRRWTNLLAGLSLLVAGTPLWLSAGKATAQYTIVSDRSGSVVSQVNLLFVNPAIGNDMGGNGTERQPFKTIARALRAAERNTVILIAPGTYSTSSGETFPLLLKTGVTIEGNPRSRGQDIVIKGGGVFCSGRGGGQPLSANGNQEQNPPSCTAASQNVTIVGASQAGLIGVTVTNPNQRGYGLWIESSSTLVVDNTFAGNTLDGISVSGNSAPLIRSNYLYDNGANGIAISGTSRPEVRDNVLSNKAAGISIGQNAAPRLIGNRISNNKDGVAIEGNAQPILRNNIIINNQRDGLVAIADSRPDLGTPSEPGGNIFRGNGRFDISNKASNSIVAAFGNQLTSRIEGRVDAIAQPSATTNRQPITDNQLPLAAVSPASSIPESPQVTPTPAVPSPGGLATRPLAVDNQLPTTAVSPASIATPAALNPGGLATRPAAVANTQPTPNSQLLTTAVSPASIATTPPQITPIPAVPSSEGLATRPAAVGNQQLTPNNQLPTTAASPPQVTPTPALPNASGIANPPAALNPSVNEQQQRQLRVMSLTRVGNSQSLPVVKPISPSSRSSVVSGNADNEQQTPKPSVSASSFPVPTGFNTQTPVVSGNRQQTPSVPLEATNRQQTLENGQPTNPQQEITFEIPANQTAPQNPASNNGNLPSTIENDRQVPKTPSRTGALPQLPLTPSPLPRLEGENDQGLNLQAVPDRNVPPINTNNAASEVPPPGIETQGKMPTPPETSPGRTPPASRGQRYRVVVEANSDSQKAALRSLVPNAFRTVMKGRTVMQVGVYSDRSYAEEMLQMLNSKGLRAAIVQLN